MPFRTFTITVLPSISPIIQVITYFLLFLWISIISLRPTGDIDANVYHMPLSLLINNSRWYPGIVNLSSHFGFPNGTSVIASIFTSFNIVGFENIPSLITWLVLGLGVFIYLIKKQVPSFIAVLTACMFALSPHIFYSSYNIGTDLPCTVFLAFGLLALSDKHFEDACVFFALSGIFKPLGALAAILSISYILMVFLVKNEKHVSSYFRISLSILLLFISSMRVYVATGNPIYPIIPLNIAPWGISKEIQDYIINGVHGTSAEGQSIPEGIVGEGLKYYSGVERTVPGFLAFVKNFTFFPDRIRSSHWFWPFLAICLIIYLYNLAKNFFEGRTLRLFNANNMFCFVLIMVLFVGWFLYSPLFRFIAGVLIFINIKFLVPSYHNSSYPARIIICGILILVSGAFLANAIGRISNVVLPLVNASPEMVEMRMPWKKSGQETQFIRIDTGDGFTYSRSTSTFCHRMPPPCINKHSLADERTLIRDYRKYNGL